MRLPGPGPGKRRPFQRPGQRGIRCLSQPRCLRSTTSTKLPWAWTALRTYFGYRSFFDDVPEETRERLAHRYRTGLELGIGTSDRTMVEAYNFLLKLGSHDSTILRAAFGDPERVLFTEIWGKGLFICSLLEYAKDVRCEFTLGHTKRKWFDEELCADGMKSTVSVRFPSPFLKNGPTQVEVTEMDGAAVSERRVVGSFEESFRRQLEHFHDCIGEGKEPLANVRDAKKDIEFLRDIVVCGMTRAVH